VVAHSAVVRGGFVPATLVDLATELPAAMVAMSTRARTGAARALLGSVTSAVVHRAHAPVLVLHP
jgi:nucleotide-binding universal stress UspA family protein